MSAGTSKSQAVILVLVGLASLAVAFALVAEQVLASRVLYSVILVVTAMGLGVLCLVKGIADLRSRGEGPRPAGADYRHVYRIFAATVVVAGMLGGVLQAGMPADYGEHGCWRGGAMIDAKARSPRHVGTAACLDCHEELVGLHSKDAHARVSCEVCHGPADGHRDWYEAHPDAGEEGGAEVPEAARLLVDESRDACLHCHGVDPSRPGGFAQIDWQEHMKVSRVTDLDLPCSTCHDAHEPLFMDRDLREARLHPRVYRCVDCHGPTMDQAEELPLRHIATFDCAYCHGDLTHKQEEVAHKDLDCTTCHLVFPDSPFAARIIRDTDPRFCLLCHRAGEFRAEDAAPSIKWPRHLDKMRDSEKDTRELCSQCHRPALHWPEEAEEEEDIDMDDLFGDDEDEAEGDGAEGEAAAEESDEEGSP